MRRAFIVAGLGLFAACRGGTDTPDPSTLEAVPSTNQQSGPAGARLAEPLAAIVRTSDGQVAVRGSVRWAVVFGDGAVLSDSVTLSDGAGRAEVAFTLGAALGTYEVRASLVESPEDVVTFTATATAPPALTAVMPTTFTAGDTLTVSGAGLSAAAQVEVGGQPARVLVGSATGLTVVAPICLAPGPVQVRVRIGTAFSNALTATYAAPQAALQLAPGEYASIDPAQLAGCATFAAAGAQGAQYLVAPQSVTGAAGLSVAYQLVGDSATVPLSLTAHAPRPLPRAAQFHDALRAQERVASRRPRPAANPPAAAQLVALARVKLGDRRTFQVCQEIPCALASDFTGVMGEAKYVGERAALFLDRDAPAGFSDEDIQSLGQLFDETLYDVNTRAFGAESDVDDNGVVIILFTTVANQLTPKSQCSTSIITGYFFGVDVDAAFFDDPRSNRGEVFYAIAPDPSGTVTCTLSTDRIRNLVPVTFIHEFQHMISYNQHVLQRRGLSEVLWLNEGLSHIAEELGGRRFEAMGDDVRFSQFAIGDVFNAYLYLQTPGSFFVLPGEGTGSLEERGAAWLFLRWVIDRYGEDITRRLLETKRTGADNVEAVTGAPISKLLAQWFLANYVSDLAGFTPPTELTYSSWRFRTTYGDLNAQLPDRFTSPFPIEPPVRDGGTLDLSGTLRSGSGDYVLIEQPANGGAFTLRLTAPGGGSLGGTVVPRLNVIRIR